MSDPSAGPKAAFDYRVGNALNEIRLMPDESAHMVATSPPYWGLRDYKKEAKP